MVMNTLVPRQIYLGLAKRAKIEQLSSTTIGYLASNKDSRKAKLWERMRILLESGCAVTLINQSLIGTLKYTKEKYTKEKKTKWTTKTGQFSTHRKCGITFTLSVFHKHREITWNCYVDEYL
jgi:hypothetical protein